MVCQFCLFFQKNSYLKKRKNKLTSVGEDMEEFKPLGTVGENVKLYCFPGQQYDSSSENQK